LSLPELVPGEFEPDELVLDELVPDEPVPDELALDELVLGAAGALLAPDESPLAAGLSEDPPFELVLVEGDEGAGAESGSVFPFRA
jgi:hypothetical protein